MIKTNKSKTYLLPLLSEFVSFNKTFYGSIKNTYIYDDESRYKDCLYILHDFSFKVPEFTKYENELINNEYFVNLIDVNDQVVYIFKFPKEYMKEYNAYKQGKYSMFGLDAKQLILSFFTNIYRNDLNAVDFLLKVKHVLFKNKSLKSKIEKELRVKLPSDAELSDIMDESSETFKLSKVMEKNDR